MDPVLDPSLSVGDGKIDGQHARLIGQIGEIERMLSSLDVDIGSLRRANQFLFNYAKEHLTYEEGYMDKHGYPGLEDHRKMHGKFIDFLREFQAEFKKRYTSDGFSSADIAELLKKIRDYLKMWVSHIRVADQKYAKWIRSRKK